MRCCQKCNTEKEIACFSVKSQNKDGLSIYCKDCMRALRRKHYVANKTKVRGDIEERKRVIIDWFKQYKSNLSCVECGFSHPAAIDFHHLDRSSKDNGVTVMVANGCSKDTILREIGKCVPLCSNCHRILHYNERNKE